MNISTDSLTTMAVFHPKYNLNQKDTLSKIPERKAIFGIFAIVEEAPANCRFIGYSENLREEIKNLFENPPSIEMKQFMQGAWIPMLMCQSIADSAGRREINAVVNEWRTKYKPGIGENGEYPGYYDS